MKYSTGFQNTNLCAISQTVITGVCSFVAQAMFQAQLKFSTSTPALILDSGILMKGNEEGVRGRMRIMRIGRHNCNITLRRTLGKL